MLADEPTWHESRPSLRRDEGGQTTIIVALSIVVLIAGMALGIEWGYGFTQRRVMQNAADAGALAAAKTLAASVLATGTGHAFRATQEELYCAAWQIADSNSSFRPAGVALSLEVSSSSDKATWSSPFPRPNACPTNPTTGTPVDANSVFVRVRASIRYPGLFSVATGQSQITAAATAIARLTGATAPSGFTWPMMRHFNANDFVDCPNPCNPLTQTPVTFWSANGAQKDIVFGNFKGLVDYSQYSPNINRTGPPAFRDNCPVVSVSCVPQLLTAPDTSGQRPLGKPRLAGNNNACTPPAPAGRWFSTGNENDQSYEKDCSIPNWTAYSFGGAQFGGSHGNGEISLDTNWFDPAPAGSLLPLQEAPDNSFRTNSRASVCPLPPIASSLRAPSCGSPSDAKHGDWIETAQSGDLGTNAAAAMIAFIDANPQYDGWQHVPTSSNNGAPEFGPHVIINVYLWDCAESFDGSAPPGRQWSLAMPKSGTDCSAIHDGNDTLDSIDRVHVLTYAPFTFYRGLVSGSKIQGFWGGAVVGDPGPCQVDPNTPGCAINPFANSVFLVSED